MRLKRFGGFTALVFAIGGLFGHRGEPLPAWTQTAALPRMGAALPIHKGRLKTMRLTSLLPAGVLLLAAFVLAGCPITIVERAVEARFSVPEELSRAAPQIFAAVIGITYGLVRARLGRRSKA